MVLLNKQNSSSVDLNTIYLAAVLAYYQSTNIFNENADDFPLLLQLL